MTPPKHFKPSKKFAYMVLSSLNQGDFDLEAARETIAKAIELSLKRISRDEEAKKKCTVAVFIMDEKNELQSWVTYKLLDSLGLRGSIADHKGVVDLLSLELQEFVRRYPYQARDVGLEMDNTGIYLMSKPFQYPVIM
jgi:hypothetical protein